LQRIWAQCLGVGSVDRGENFFDIGGDSLVAISVAMTASQEGVELTPQDLYEHPSVVGLAEALVARYGAGGLTAAAAPGEVVSPPVPPNLSYFFERGLADRGSWQMPLVLRLAGEVGVDDVCAVLTAVVGHH
jgi:phthiocerol/phenolphthiocerol synthesis type-I polyketide synthase E